MKVAEEVYFKNINNQLLIQKMKTVERKSGSINSEILNDIKQQFSKILKNLEGGQKILHSTTTKFNEVKYQKNSELEKQHKIMLYELRLVTNLLDKLGINQENELFVQNKDEMDRQIKLGQMNLCLQIKMEKIQREAQSLKNENKELKTKNESLTKNIKIYENRICQLQKHGGVTKIIQLKDIVKQVNMKNERLENEKEKQKQEIKKLKQKCNILQQLNKQTEEKLSVVMLEVLDLKGARKSKKENIEQNRGEQNREKEQPKDRNYKIELFAAKEQIKSLKNRLVELEQQKENQKIKHQNKENIYEKMLVKKLRN